MNNFTLENIDYEYYVNLTDQEFFNLNLSYNELQHFHPNLTHLGK